MSNSAITGPTLINFPAGMVMPYAGSTTPAGWLECNGAEVDISAYPALAAALGSTWNTAKNPLTGANYAAPAAGKFRVPDMRGAFLRGSSGGVNNAQGVATGLAEFQSHKTAKNGLGNSSSAISGTAAGQAHSGSGAVVANSRQYFLSGNNIAPTDGIANITSTNVFTGVQNSNAGFPVTASISHTHAASALSGTAAAQTITGDSETRPDSVGVRYLIKI